MSVWPHLTIGPSVSADNLTLRMMNQGIGPAIIETVQIVHSGRELEGIEGLMSIVPDTLRTSFSYSSLWPGQVIMAGEPMDLFSVNSSGAAGYLAGELGAGRINLEICYSSVYGDTWVTNGLQVEESTCE